VQSELLLNFPSDLAVRYNNPQTTTDRVARPSGTNCNVADFGSG